MQSMQSVLGSSPQTSCVLCSETWSTAAAGLPGCSLSCTGPERGRKKILRFLIHPSTSCTTDGSCQLLTDGETLHHTGKICHTLWHNYFLTTGAFKGENNQFNIINAVLVQFSSNNTFKMCLFIIVKYLQKTFNNEKFTAEHRIFNKDNKLSCWRIGSKELDKASH